jgi:hypothetical protein
VRCNTAKKKEQTQLKETKEKKENMQIEKKGKFQRKKLQAQTS